MWKMESCMQLKKERIVSMCIVSVFRYSHSFGMNLIFSLMCYKVSYVIHSKVLLIDNVPIVVLLLML